uniref:Uncharacterized protein n=1 Tax=Timema poppense TaxID=170557 RepID=A0A7R9D8F6_TIMPO|nr:unnamed protein product [Timema poppensis]
MKKVEFGSASLQLRFELPKAETYYRIMADGMDGSSLLKEIPIDRPHKKWASIQIKLMEETAEFESCQLDRSLWCRKVKLSLAASKATYVLFRGALKRNPMIKIDKL